MHYVRFLKAPRVQGTGSGRNVAGLCTIATDLGDDFYAGELDLDIILTANDEKEEILAQQRLTWKAGMRALPFEVILDYPIARVRPCLLEIKPHDTRLLRTTIDDNGRILMPAVASVHSSLIIPPRGPADSDKMLMQKVDLANDEQLKVWIDSGERIEGHIWDAGIALATLIGRQDYLESHMPQFAKALDADRSNGGLQVLELGCGTGLAGLALVKAWSKTELILSDVKDAKSLVTRNIASNRRAPRSSANFQVLDWDEPLPDEISRLTFSIIIASDVTYNPDSGQALVNTISAIEKTSPGAHVVIAMKKRHASESSFFDIMKQASFHIAEEMEILAPSGLEPDDLELAQKILIYTFRRK